ncbi:hypothetical protein Aph01nite_17780 [Acrocarpospora phusangensis]|uniref:Uncharacterized protein n=1 Tax=Acrocarpospora phusangensis TaxID=1070424 RepID=A0A919Q7M4_9ACTN|nr:hypothetical protein Aph01nite_17780 [Acrocarpospora phusangensis]
MGVLAGTTLITFLVTSYAPRLLASVDRLTGAAEVVVYAYEDPSTDRDVILAYERGDQFKDVEALHQKLVDRDYGLGKGGYQALRSTNRVIVENRMPADVAVVGIAFKLLEKRNPPAGTAVWLNPQGGETVVQLGFDLDSFNSRARAIAPDQELGADYFAQNRVLLKPGEQIEFSMRGDATRQLYLWRAEISLYVGGTVKKVMAPPEHERPFATTGLAKTFTSAFDNHAGDIKRVDPGLFCARHAMCGPREDRD